MKSEENKHHHSFVESNFKKNNTNELIHKTETDIQISKTNLGYQRGNMWAGGINQELGMNIYTLPYIRWITNNSLLYITGNSAQYSVITYMRKES